MSTTKNTNRLINEKSPYLLQHASNPVDWYPWGREAFDKAAREDKPIFLSIGYSTCHWCHVMAHESFEDKAVAEILNKYFISIKVDREERPDIDNIYMRVCQSFTGGGGWPTSIFMTAEQKPFFAGTYFPKDRFVYLLNTIHDNWSGFKSAILEKGEDLTSSFYSPDHIGSAVQNAPIDEAVAIFRQNFDSVYGGFGRAPKFPSPHNLMLLLNTAPDMAEKTLLQMYKGGIFDHVGYGFSRYSTDAQWLVPHFEKMLYDNALLTIVYLMAFESTGNDLYRSVAERTLLYMTRELATPEGGFYSAQDADSGGVEGKYYVFTPVETVRLLGETDGRRFNSYFGITERGNFEGKNIPNLIANNHFDPTIDNLLPKVYSYRKSRIALRTDTKILTAWNALAIAACADAYRILGKQEYLDTASRTVDFIDNALSDGNTLYTSITDGKRGSIGFLDDYAFYVFALIRMHQATQNERFLKRAVALTNRTITEYFDREDGGFFFSGHHNEQLIFNPKETYDGALPSGNSVMAYNLSRLAALMKSDAYYDLLRRQQAFMNAAASGYPSGYSFYLYSTLLTKEIVCVLKNPTDLDTIKIQSHWIFQVSTDPQYPLLNGRTTFYVCEGNTCLPPTNELPT